MPWRDWEPKLNNDKTLKEVLSLMDGDDQGDIPWQVRLFENPESPFAMSGAVSLRDHDCIHALLCTSFYPDDEAFTVGWTMGTSTTISSISIKIFKLWSKWGYPGQYAWTKQNLEYFDKGFNLGRDSKIRNVHNFRWDAYMDLTMAELRDKFGISWPKDGSVGTDFVTKTQKNHQPNYVYHIENITHLAPSQIEEVANELGERGWEAFSANGHLMYFKKKV